MAAERNTEIWSTRLQRELLALTTNNASEGAKEDVVGVLPPFVTVKTHELDFPKGDCAVSFLVDIAKPGGNASSTDDMIVVTMDASLQKKDNGTVDPMAVAYPFLRPSAYLTSGSKRFPDGSTIKDGDEIDIEMDWTPSLHLTDAILNVALKIKESILQGEPFHGASGANKQDPVEEMVNKAKRFGSSFRKGLAGLAEKGSSPADKPEDKDKSPKKGGLRLPGRKKKKEEKKLTSATKAPKANSGEIRIGDEINMLEAPWVDCQGVYSCKAIRRPTFVDDAIAVAAQSTEENNQVRSSSVFRDDDADDQVPSSLNDYMSLQAGTIGQVCLDVWQVGMDSPFQSLTDASLIVPIQLVMSSLVIRSRKLDLAVLEPCFERLPNPHGVYWRNPF
jgi:hypothetical protein